MPRFGRVLCLLALSPALSGCGGKGASPSAPSRANGNHPWCGILGWRRQLPGRGQGGHCGRHLGSRLGRPGQRETGGGEDGSTRTDRCHCSSLHRR